MTLHESAFGTFQHGKAVTVIQSVIYVLHVCRSRERDRPNACCFNCFIYSRSLKCPLHITSYALRIRVSIMEL